jgi:hypothetical protein
MRAAILVLLVACHHAEEAKVTVQVTCGSNARSLAVTGDLRIDEHLCGQPWTALRIEHGPRTELVKAIAGREVWLRRNGRRARVEVRGTGAMTFDGVTEIAEDPPPSRGASVAIDANGVVTDVTLDDLRARFESAGSGGRNISLCAVAAAYVAGATKIEVTGETARPIVVTPAECAARGLALRISGKGELRLRAASGDHLLQSVTRIRISL